MGRLTISLPDELHRALKEAAARRGQTIGQVVSESLEFYGVKTEGSATALVERARRLAGMREDDAVRLAVEETREVRGA